MQFLAIYKRRYHFSFNFYSIFLLVTFLPDFAGVSPDFAVYPFWALKAFLACIVIFRYKKTLYDLRRPEKLFLFVAFIYFTNMLVDRFLQVYPQGYGSHIDLIDFFLCMLIAFSFRYDPTFSSDRAFNFFVWTLAAGLIISYFFATESPLVSLAGRYDANSTVNTINYGQMGCAMSIVSIFGFMNNRIKHGKIIYVLLFFLGIISIIKAGSRSPVVVLAAVSVIYLLARAGFIKGILIGSIVLLVLWLSMGFLVELTEAMGSSLSSRMVTAVEKGETSGRSAIYENTLNIISDSLLFGDYYLIPSGVGRNGYPHNFFLEAFLTMGLVGGIPFTIMTLITVVKSYKLLHINHDSAWIILLFLQVLVYGMFSSSLFSSQDFWSLVLFILSISTVEMKKDVTLNN